MTVECKCPICKGKEHWDPPQPPNPLHVGLWRYQFPPLTQEQADVGQHISGVGWMIPVKPCEHGKIDRHLLAQHWVTVRPAGKTPYLGSVDNWCEGAPELRALLNASIEENNDEHNHTENEWYPDTCSICALTKDSNNV